MKKNNFVITMTYNDGVIEQTITVIDLTTEQIVATQSCTIYDYIEKIIALCRYFNTEFVACDERLWSWEFRNNNLNLLKEGEIIPESEENE